MVQVALEGAVSADSARAALAAGQLPQGDMLPWMIGQQFQDSKFPSLSGARIVRIATHPGILKAGYGSKAVKELCKYYQGEFAGACLYKPVSVCYPPPSASTVSGCSCAQCVANVLVLLVCKG